MVSVNSKKSLLCSLVISLLPLTACKQEPKPTFVEYIERHPAIASFHNAFKDIKDLPQMDRVNAILPDVRCSNLSNADLSNRYDDLLHTTFDSQTQWPDSLPEGFDPQKVLELYKDPGLGVRELHKQGVTGKNVGIAIIDQWLLVDHVEYKDRLRYYEEIDTDNLSTAMHAPAVASIACGKTVGVAPEADLYFFECWPGIGTGEAFQYDYTTTAECIKKIIDINKTLPKNRKIRVISISLGFVPNTPGYDKYADAVTEAEKNDILVISTQYLEKYDTMIMGISKTP